MIPRYKWLSIVRTITVNNRIISLNSPVFYTGMSLTPGRHGLNPTISSITAFCVCRILIGNPPCQLLFTYSGALSPAMHFVRSTLPHSSMHCTYTTGTITLPPRASKTPTTLAKYDYVRLASRVSHPIHSYRLPRVVGTDAGLSKLRGSQTPFFFYYDASLTFHLLPDDDGIYYTGGE